MYTLNSRVCPQKKNVNLSATKLFFLAIFSIALVSVGLSLSAQAQETPKDSQTSLPVSQSQDMNVAPSTYTKPVVTINNTNLTIVKNNTGWLSSSVSPATENQKVYWSSSNSDIVSVDAYGGLTAKNIGVVEITATSTHGIQATSRVTIIHPIEVPPTTQIKTSISNLHLTIGESERIYAQVTSTPLNSLGNGVSNTQHVRWISANPYIATVDPSGNVTAHHFGQTVIIADAGNYVSTTVAINVNYSRENSVEIYPMIQSTILKGSRNNVYASVNPLIISNPTVRWESSDPSVISVNSTGQYIALRAGVAVIKAISTHGLTDQRTFSVIEPSVVPAPVVITLDYTNLDVIKNTHAWLTATVSPATESQYVTWSTSNANIVSVDSSGKLTATNVGTAEITAKSVHGVVAKTVVTVRYAPATAIHINVPKNDLLIGETTTLSAQITPQHANPTVSWVSNNPYVASVDETGKVTAHRVGQALITAVAADNYVTAEVYMNVKQIFKPGITINLPYNYKLTVSKGTSNRLVAIGSYLDAFPIIGWYSNDPSVVTINHKGEYNALKPGIVTITVYSADGYSDQTTITVTD